MDSRYLHLARNLVGFSINLKKGEKVLVDAYNTPMGMVIAIVRAVRERGGLPFVQLQDAAVNRELVAEGVEDQFIELASWELDRMKRMDAYVAIRGSSNIFEMSDVPPEKMSTFSSALKSVLDWRVKKTKWVVLRWPSPSMAQQALMSTEAFRDFYFRVCTMDYSLMIPGMKALKSRMDAADQVRISGDDTDLCFSIKGIGAVACGGAHNIPDGEVFSSPVRDSVEGTISFNAPTVYQGASFDNIRLTFKKGKIVEATGSNTGRLNEILDQDEGARYIGEFAIAFNPHILHPMRDILFDEKIAGSFHFTPGQAYEEADNGNRSQVHWDMVCIQRPDYGGGSMFFDGELIRQDGIFIPDDLQPLNPDYLLGEE